MRHSKGEDKTRENNKKLQSFSKKIHFNTWTYINFMQLHNYLNVFPPSQQFLLLLFFILLLFLLQFEINFFFHKKTNFLSFVSRRLFLNNRRSKKKIVKLRVFLWNNFNIWNNTTSLRVCKRREGTRALHCLVNQISLKISSGTELNVKKMFCKLKLNWTERAPERVRRRKKLK